MKAPTAEQVARPRPEAKRPEPQAQVERFRDSKLGFAESAESIGTSIEGLANQHPEINLVDELLEAEGLKDTLSLETQSATEKLRITSESSVLSDRDKQYLKEAGKNLIEKFLKDYPNKLPDAILLPDTSARPLAYLLRPVLEKVAQKRGIRKPEIHFIKTVSREDAGLRAFERGYTDAQSALDEMQNEISELDNQIANTKDVKARYQLEKQRDWKQAGYNIWRLTVGEQQARRKRIDSQENSRVSIIESHLKSLGIENPEMVIFDDYATEDARTITGLRRSMNKNLPAYVLLAQKQNPIPDEINFGLVDPYTQEPGQMSAGFEYRENKEKAIGVTKIEDNSSSFVTLSKNRDPQAMRTLREEMGKIGQKIAEDL